MGIKFQNLTQFGENKRTITIMIEQSGDGKRVGRHDIAPTETFEVNANERGHVINWLSGKQVPFVHEAESAWVITENHDKLSVSNLRAFTRPQIQAIRRRRETLLGLSVFFTPITKERRG